MKAQRQAPDLDATDLRILDLLQENCKRPLASIGEKVGLSAPAVMERVHKMEEAGVIHGYVAIVDARMLGMDVTAFIGVSVAHPRMIGAFEREVANIDAVLECHHVTGAHTLLLDPFRKAPERYVVERRLPQPIPHKPPHQAIAPHFQFSSPV